MSGKRFRRWYRLKWVGLAACLVLLVAGVSPPIKINAKSTEVWLFNFCVIVFRQPVGPGIEDDIWHNWKVDVGNDPGFLPKFRRVTLRAGTLMYISLPLQPFCLFMIITTSVLWRLDRRYPPGCCQGCGYNLRGLTEPRCPECGTEFDPSTLPSPPG